MPPKRRQSLNKNKIICIQCRTEVLENEDALDCDICKKTLHSVCTKMDKKQIEKLIANTSLEYKCHFCIPQESSKLISELNEIKLKLNQLDDIRETIKFMSDQYDDVVRGVKKNTNQIEYLRKENKILRDEVKQLKSSIKYLNDVRVRNDCLISGLTADDTVDPRNVVLDLAQQTGAAISENDIEDAYLLPNRNKKNVKSSIIVKFSNKNSKKVFMNEKVKMKNIDKLKTVYLNDCMSKETMEIFKYAKSLKEVGFKFVYAKGCNIFARQNEKSRINRIKSMEDVDELLISVAGGKQIKRTLNNKYTSHDDNDDDGDGEVVNSDDGESIFRSPS